MNTATKRDSGIVGFDVFFWGGGWLTSDLSSSP